jgi:hypothetical protein
MIRENHIVVEIILKIKLFKLAHLIFNEKLL